MIPRPARHLPRFASLLLLALAGSGAVRAQDARPVVDASTVKNERAANNNLPTMFVVGDSTARSASPLRGWGDEFAAFFDPAKINVVNRAIGGRSSRTFIAEGRWDSVLAETKPGDFMVVQFGHNDVGPLDARGKFRGSLKGMGDATQDVVKPDGKTETVHTFGWYMTKYATDAKAKGVNVVIASPIPHKKWQNDFTDYRKWDAAAAQAAGVPFIDVHEITSAKYTKLGPAGVEKLFADKGTHTNVEGAQINAASVVAGLKSIPGDPFAPYLSAKGKAVPAAPASH
jgi:lysophospholipase L1-like esterase